MTDTRSPPDDVRTSADEVEPADSRMDASGSSVSRPPGPRGLPVLGSTISLGRDPLRFTTSIQEYGDVVAYTALGREFVAVFDPLLVEEILLTRSDEFWKGTFETVLGDVVAPEGVVFADGEKWRRQRRLLQSVFTPERIDLYADIMVAETEAAVDGWNHGAIVDLREELSTLTVAILTRTLFDVELAAAAGETVIRLVRALAAVVDELIGPRGLLPERFRSRRRRAFDRAMADLDDLVATLVTQHRRSGTGGDDMLSILVRAEYPDGSPLTREEIRDQLVTFLIAGHETTATAVTYACWLLAGDRSVGTRLDRELDAVCGDCPPTVQNHSALEMTGAVVNETLRLYPSFFAFHREPRETTTIGGYQLPEETVVQLPVYAIHRDERWWPESDAFHPDRWLDDGGRGVPDRPEYTYFPFGGGPRHCLGMRFAKVELRLVLATIAQRLTFDRVTESIEPSTGLSLDPGEVRMRIRKR